MLRQVTPVPFWSVFPLFSDSSPTPSSCVRAPEAIMKILAGRRVPHSTYPLPSLFFSQDLLGLLERERAFPRKLEEHPAVS